MAVAAVFVVLIAGCGGGSGRDHGRGGRNRHGAAANPVRLIITPAEGSIDRAPQRGITVTMTGGTTRSVTVRSNGQPVRGSLNAAGTVWHSSWALDVSQRYTVTATATPAPPGSTQTTGTTTPAVGSTPAAAPTTPTVSTTPTVPTTPTAPTTPPAPSGPPVTATSTFRTFTPARTVTVRIFEGANQAYGVGMPIILYFSAPVAYRAAVERALQVRTSRRVVGAWYWDPECGFGPVCLYFRPRHYWPPHTRVSFTGHLDGVEMARGVWGDHTLTQSFDIGTSLIVVASTAHHTMNVYRSGRLFAHWPISTGRPGDDTPDGTYLTIQKSNPVDMVGPGYNIEVPWSVRFTWSGDYLHDAYWSVGEQGFTNVSHGCVNMSPADAETYYQMAVPGDPVTITGSPRAGTWDNGWTMWFLPWKQYLRGSALHRAVVAGPRGSRFLA